MARCSVLVAEDDDDLRESLSLVLRSEGFRTQAAANGQQALALCRAQRPDVVLLDLHMPGMKGTDVLEQLKAKPATAKARVILLTGDSRAKLIDLAGQAKVLHKPFSLDELEAAVTEACAA